MYKGLSLVRPTMNMINVFARNLFTMVYLYKIKFKYSDTVLRCWNREPGIFRAGAVKLIKREPVIGSRESGSRSR
jgi:hypothetical protein